MGKVFSYTDNPKIYDLNDVSAYTQYGDWPVIYPMAPVVSALTQPPVSTVRFGSDSTIGITSNPTPSGAFTPPTTVPAVAAAVQLPISTVRFGTDCFTL
jgi:hypothetical protein